MGRGRSGRVSASAPEVPEWREAFHDGRDHQRSGDVNHESRTVSRALQRDWDEFSRGYQTGVTQSDINNLKKEWDFSRGEGYGYVRSGNSFKINQLLYDPANANKTDEEIFTRTDRRGVLRDLKNDDAKARQRFVDQPGQWVDTTPASVKKRQEKAWKELFASMEKKTPAKKTGTQTKKK